MPLKERLSPVEPSIHTYGWKLKHITPYILAVVLLASTCVAAWFWYQERSNANRDYIATVERELRAGAKLKQLDITGIRVYYSDTEGLVADWFQGNQQCTNVKIVPPRNSSDLYGTQPVDGDSGDCKTSTSSRGINPGGN